MTHVFVSPHPDDAALSCGGLIAGLRDLGQAVTILTVYSGTSAGSSELSGYQRVALGFGSKIMWPSGEVFRRSNISNDVELVPVRGGAPPWAADPERIELTQERANTQARQFWQRASWTRSANITNVETPDRPLADSVPAQGTLDIINLRLADIDWLRGRPERAACRYQAVVDRFPNGSYPPYIAERVARVTGSGVNPPAARSDLTARDACGD